MRTSANYLLECAARGDDDRIAAVPVAAWAKKPRRKSPRGHQRALSRRLTLDGQCTKDFWAATTLGRADLRGFMVPMMSRCRGCLDTVKRINTAWRGDTVAMMHDLRIVKSRGRQWAHG